LGDTPKATVFSRDHCIPQVTEIERHIGHVRESLYYSRSVSRRFMVHLLNS